MGNTVGRPKRVLMLAAEVAPFAATSEMAVVIGALAGAVRALGHDVRVVMPRYRHIAMEQFGLRPYLAPFAVPIERRSDAAQVYEAQAPSGVPVYLVDNGRYFGGNSPFGYADDAEGFIFYARAALELLRHPEMNWQPDIIHCHGWQTGIVPNWLSTVYAKDPLLAQAASVFTIHRLSHQGVFGYRVLQVAGIEEHGFIYPAGITDLGEVVDLMGRGLYYADAITTVSESYAREIQTPEYGERLDPLLRDRSERLFGILHGIDTEAYNPATDRAIAARYHAVELDLRLANKAALQRMLGLEPRTEAPLLGMVSRLTDTKGLDLLAEIVAPLVEHVGAQLVIVGVGDPKYHEMLNAWAQRWPRQVSAQFTFNDILERQVYAGSDMFLMPSRVEPCGLGQMIAMRYGSIPIVREVGGLADTVSDYDPQAEAGTGFRFVKYDALALYTAIVRACEVWRHGALWQGLQRRAMTADLGWARSAARYVEVYDWTSARRRESAAATRPAVS
ncbi:MAG: glycogen synthase [Chloroflexota bacterium]